MRTTIISLIAIVGVVLAAPQDAYQISDGQVQAPTGAASTSSTVPAPPAPTAYTPPVESSVVISTTPSASSSSPVAPVSSSTSAPVVPAPSYPVPANSTVPLTTGGAVTQSTLPTYGTPAASSNEVGATATESSPATAAPNAAGMVEAQIGFAGVAVAGLLALFA